MSPSGRYRILQVTFVARSMLTAKHGPTVGNTIIPKAGCGTAALWDKRLRKYEYLAHDQLTIERREKSGDMKG